MEIFDYMRKTPNYAVNHKYCGKLRDLFKKCEIACAAFKYHTCLKEKSVLEGKYVERVDCSPVTFL